MASYKVEICLKKKNPPEHKYSVTFVSKVGTIKTYKLGYREKVQTTSYRTIPILHKSIKYTKCY